MGMLSPGEDALIRETNASVRRRKRRRQRQMLWLLTGVTTVVLLVIATFVRDISRVPAAVPTAAVSHPRVTDTAAGLFYRLLSSPWRKGCPSILGSPMLDWNAGENTVAGQVRIGKSLIDWHGLACSGQLQQQFAYADPGDLETAAVIVVGALDSAYYARVPHSVTIEGSSAMQVGGHQAWMIKFGMSYPDDASQGLTWSSELGAVVVVDRGVLHAPAVFYVSVPANLGTQNVATLIDSLRLG
jgi:hypothetical protein